MANVRLTKARNALAAFIATFSTTKQLHEAWPDGLAFYANIVVEPVNLPALQTVEINKMLGLGLAA